MIHLDRVSYRYPDRQEPALGEISLDVEEGEMVLVAGLSGAGKSSLLRIFNGLVPRFHGGVLRGRARVGGRDPVALGPRGMSDLVGFAAQDPESQFVARVVEDELAFSLECYAVAPAEMRRRVGEVLEQLAIAPLRRRAIETLSGGERQRVAIAGVLTLRPRLLVLDEPTSQLDPAAATAVMELLGRLRRELGLTVVLSEHRLERVVPYVDRVVLLERGAPPRIGPAAEVLAGSPLAPPAVHRAALDPPPLDAPGAAITARGVRLTYPGGLEALRGVDFDIPRGCLTALVGVNGAGKSTLLKILVGLLQADAGTVRLRGSGVELDPARDPLAEITRTVGFVPQNPSRLLFHERAVDEIAFTLRTHGRASEDPLAHLAEIGLAHVAEADPRDLSTGERQRLALAAVLAAEPEILLLDEPTRGLDAPRKAALAGRLVALRERGVTVVLATHDQDLIARCADHAIVLDGGRVASPGESAEGDR